MVNSKRTLLTLSLGLTATGLAIADDALTATDISKPIQLQPHQKELVLRLASNATTGYAWLLQSYDHQLLTLERHSYNRPKKMMIGAGGVEEWYFYVNPSVYLAKQTGEIHLVYTQPWHLPYPAATTVTWVSSES